MNRKTLLFGILTAAAVFSQGNTVAIHGAFDGRGTGAIQGQSIVLTESGRGTASFLGRFVYNIKVTVDMPTGLGNGTVQFTTASGDTLTGSFVSRAEGTDTTQIGYVVFLVRITGGTGRFRGVTGTLTVDYVTDESTIPNPFSSGALSGTLTTGAR